jgi:hypothetical protein
MRVILNVPSLVLISGTPRKRSRVCLSLGGLPSNHREGRITRGNPVYMVFMNISLTHSQNSIFSSYTHYLAVC